MHIRPGGKFSMLAAARQGALASSKKEQTLADEPDAGQVERIILQLGAILDKENPELGR